MESGLALGSDGPEGVAVGPADSVRAAEAIIRPHEHCKEDGQREREDPMY
jgi:hypothetical protein